ncbi:MAG: N-acetylmuramoyl-L-alanine amidase [bacterium]
MRFLISLKAAGCVVGIFVISAYVLATPPEVPPPTPEDLALSSRIGKDSRWFEPNGPGPQPSPRKGDMRAGRQSRELSNVTGEAPLGTSGQPQGALSGRMVFVSAGHGWVWNGTTWGLQRPLLLSMNEDYGNSDQFNFLAHYLFNAGATIVPTRPLSRQKLEVVMDNTSPTVTFSGLWEDSVSPKYYGPGNPPYRFAVAAPTETASATYTPDFAEAGFYPVYCWAEPGVDRVSGQLYRVRHTGGESQIRVNHRRIGYGWVWLGNYYFEAGNNVATGSVIVSNLALQDGVTTGVVVADAIRFGNGMGNIDRGGGVSGYEREAEGARYWAQRMAGTAYGTDVYGGSGGNDLTGDYAARPLMAAAMRQDDGQGYYGDLFIEMHSNASAGSGTARGSTALVSNYLGTTLPNQVDLASLVVTEVNNDCQIEDESWEHPFQPRPYPVVTGNYWYIDDSYLGNEMNATVVETAFHDNVLDVDLLRDPKFRNVMARAVYQGIARYFNKFDANPLNFLPEPPTRLRAFNDGSGGVIVAWLPGPAGGAGGDAPDKFRVYGSSNGLGFGSFVETVENSAVISGLTPGSTYYFRVAGVNAGGESMPSEVLGVRVHASGRADTLVVNGYDRIDRFNAVPEFPNNPTDDRCDRILLRRNNSYDYIIQYARALAANDRYFDSCSNEAVSSGDVRLPHYRHVVWSLGEESVRDSTFDATERAKVSEFLAAGGCLFVSGAEIGFDLEGQSQGVNFFQDDLRASFAADDAGSYQATGLTESIFEGLEMDFPPGPDRYDVDSPDQIDALNGSILCANYATGGGAAIQYSGGTPESGVVMLAFPFEAITSAQTRDSVIQRVFAFFDTLGDQYSVIGWMLR